MLLLLIFYSADAIALLPKLSKSDELVQSLAVASAHLQAITLHPVKDSSFQHRLHNFYSMLRLQQLRTRQLNLLNKQKLLSNYLRRTYINELVDSRQIPPERFTSLQRTSFDAESILQENLFNGLDEQHRWREHQIVFFSAAYANEQQRRRKRPAYTDADAYTYAWHSFDGAGRFYSTDALVPRLVVPTHLKLALHLLVDSALLELNRGARQRLRVLDYKSTNYDARLLLCARPAAQLPRVQTGAFIECGGRLKRQ